MSGQMTAKKKELRTFLKNVRDHIGAQSELKSQKEMNIHKFLVNLVASKIAEPLFSYCAHGNEVNLKSFNSLGQKVALPKVMGEHSMKFFIPTGDLIENKMGILEPNDKCSLEVNKKECGFILVPGLGFDRNGSRIGMGKGFYDRYLKDFAGVKVGVCFYEQIVDEPVPTESHDVLMDYIVTDKFILKPLLRVAS